MKCVGWIPRRGCEWRLKLTGTPNWSATAPPTVPHPRGGPIATNAAAADRQKAERRGESVTLSPARSRRAHRGSGHRSGRPAGISSRAVGSAARGQSLNEAMTLREPHSAQQRPIALVTTVGREVRIVVDVPADTDRVAGTPRPTPRTLPSCRRWRRGTWRPRACADARQGEALPAPERRRAAPC